jgi:uncharacterized protein (DUF1697 family)
VTATLIAFMRGINVGGHMVKKAELCAPFEAIGLENVRSFIASGNIIFDTDKATKSAVSKLEHDIEHALHKALGYEVATFVRTLAEVAAIAEHQPFGPDEPAAGTSLIVGFFKDAPGAEAHKALQALSNDIDQFRLNGRELYWLARQGIAKSSVKSSDLGKALGKVDTTTRNITTVRKLAARYPPPS